MYDETFAGTIILELTLFKGGVHHHFNITKSKKTYYVFHGTGEVNDDQELTSQCDSNSFYYCLMQLFKIVSELNNNENLH